MQGVGCRVEAMIKVKGSLFKVQGSGFMRKGLRFTAYNLKSGAEGQRLRFRVSG